MCAVCLNAWLANVRKFTRKWNLTAPSSSWQAPTMKVGTSLTAYVLFIHQTALNLYINHTYTCTLKSTAINPRNAGKKHDMSVALEKSEVLKVGVFVWRMPSHLSFWTSCARSWRLDGTQRRIFLLRRRSCVRHFVAIQSGSSTPTHSTQSLWPLFAAIENKIHVVHLLLRLILNRKLSLKGGLDINNYNTTLPMNKGIPGNLVIPLNPRASCNANLPPLFNV